MDVTRRTGKGLLVVALLVLGACESTVGSPGGFDRERGDEPIQTTSEAYELRKNGDFLEVGIDYTYTNPTGARVYLSNCNGSFGLQLERLTDAEWQVAWTPVHPACLSPPIVIGAGATFDHALIVSAGLFGSNTRPQFDVEDPSGIYRIVWTDALSSFDDSEHPFGSTIPLEARVSNSFRLDLR